MAILMEISPAELVDKMTILEVKLDNIADPAKLANVRREYEVVSRTVRDNVPDTPELAKLMIELRNANATLWKIEDEIRDHERNGDFGENFVRLARSVYHTNDARAAIKRRINELLDSTIIEEKSYSQY